MLLSVCRSFLPAFPFLHRQISVLSRTDARTLRTKWIKGRSSSHSRVRFSHSLLSSLWQLTPDQLFLGPGPQRLWGFTLHWVTFPSPSGWGGELPWTDIWTSSWFLYKWCYIRKIHDRIKPLCIYWFLCLVTSFFLLVYLVIWSLTITLNFIHWYIPHPKVNISSWPPYTLGLLSDS